MLRDGRSQSWNGPRPEPVGPGSMLGQHYLSPELSFFQARHCPIPESCTKVIFYEISLVNLSPKVKYSWARALLEPETQSPSTTQAWKIWAHSSSSRLSLLQPTDVSINGRKWIIQEVDVPVAVDRPGQAHPLLLASRQVDPLLPDLSHVWLGQDGQVRPQGASI